MRNKGGGGQRVRKVGNDENPRRVGTAERDDGSDNSDAPRPTGRSKPRRSCGGSSSSGGDVGGGQPRMAQQKTHPRAPNLELRVAALRPLHDLDGLGVLPPGQLKEVLDLETRLGHGLKDGVDMATHLRPLVF